MTLDELKQLPPRERDALVAERVMGWKVMHEWPEGYGLQASEGPWKFHPLMTDERGRNLVVALPHFEEDPRWAVELMEKMREMRFSPDEHYPGRIHAFSLAVVLNCRGESWECGWEVQSPHGNAWALVIRGNRHIRLSASAPSAGEAVVLVALLGSFHAEKQNA